MSYPPEVHPWTVGWFESLPEQYQQLDAVQRNPERPPWDGLTPFPMQVDESGGWALEFGSADGRMWRQQFFSPPGEKVYFQGWVKNDSPTNGSVMFYALDLGAAEGTSALITFEEIQNVQGGELLSGWFYPPVSGQFTILFYEFAKYGETGYIPGTIPVFDAVNVSKRSVEYHELPRPGSGDTSTYYPLLRYMDGIGQLGGQFRQISNDLWGGHYTNPDTCPDKVLPWLAQMMGVHRRVYQDLTLDRMRLLLRETASQGLAAVGSRASLTGVVKSFLTGDKLCAVAPHPTLAHTIRVGVILTEVPGGDLAAVERGLRATGVIPAGHAIQVVEAGNTWDEWEGAAGANWNELEAKAPRWFNQDNLGVPFV